ncbi:nucleosome assembly protein 1-like 2 [Condylostylus longicornis]|uniref:nucleosome assembly protein 1-like 2 n=1 Tax=Condylostylus longicornis TaxID=2530218 RepID=UPI00244DD32D|nr:nucleosome assembly protein 1-like 2 [Condylostylus longicornis]
MMQYKSEILRRNESMQYANQPSEVKKRVAALMKQQIQIINLDVQFNKRVLEIEKEFETKYQEIFAKRCDIVNGNYEPTEQECNYNDMNVTQSLENLNLNEGNLLQHLIDVRATTKTEPTLSFVLEFHFSPNDYFSNTILTKEYFLNSHNQEIYKCDDLEKDFEIGCYLKEVVIPCAVLYFTSESEEFSRSISSSSNESDSDSESEQQINPID